MLELDEGQLSRPVLRGRGGSNTSLLPGRSVAGSSRRGRVCAGPDPASLAWGVQRGAWGGRTVARWTLEANQVSGVPESGWPLPLQPRFPGDRNWVDPSTSDNLRLGHAWRRASIGSQGTLKALPILLSSLGAFCQFELRVF